MRTENWYCIVKNDSDAKQGVLWYCESEEGCLEIIDMFVKKGAYKLEDVHVEKLDTPVYTYERINRIKTKKYEN
jgi:hypothetical protein